MTVVNPNSQGKRIENTTKRRGEGQLFIVRLRGEASIQNRDHGDTARATSRDKIAVFVDVDLDLAHE
jgi:hypothetical protein